jgi:hypothetical protein
MSTAPKIIPKPVIVGFFVLGLLSSVAFRAIILLQKICVHLGATDVVLRRAGLHAVLHVSLLYFTAPYARHRAYGHHREDSRWKNSQRGRSGSDVISAQVRARVAGRLELPRDFLAINRGNSVGLITAGKLNAVRKNQARERRNPKTVKAATTNAAEEGSGTDG